MIHDPKLIDSRFRESLDRYQRHHIETGGFLRAVLENNLAEAVLRADEIAFMNLPHVLSYVINELPSICWGSAAAVESWLSRRKDVRPCGACGEPLIGETAEVAVGDFTTVIHAGCVREGMTVA